MVTFLRFFSANSVSITTYIVLLFGCCERDQLHVFWCFVEIFEMVIREEMHCFLYQRKEDKSKLTNFSPGDLGRARVIRAVYFMFLAGDFQFPLSLGSSKCNHLTGRPFALSSAKI